MFFHEKGCYGARCEGIVVICYTFIDLGRYGRRSFATQETACGEDDLEFCSQHFY